MRLEIGKKYTTKELFNTILGEDVKKGKAFYTQLSKIEDIIEFNVEKVGRGKFYTILDIYDS